jgi:hypothetical protein
VPSILAIPAMAIWPSHALPLPPVIPDWRVLERVHPRPSQIGVGLRDQALIGVEFAILGSDPCHPCSSVVRFCFSDHPITRCPDHPIFCVLLPMSLSQRPPPPNAFVDNKGPTPIRPSGHRTVEVFVCVFQRSNRAQFQPAFPVFTVRSAEGRKAYSISALARGQ